MEVNVAGWQRSLQDKSASTRGYKELGSTGKSIIISMDNNWLGLNLEIITGKNYSPMG